MQKAAIRAQLERYPALYLALLRLKRTGHWSRDWVVCRKSDVTIEGFPRSANSFALSAFRSAQPAKCRIATHVHSYAQVLQSVRLGIPTLVLLRAPKDACLSLAALTYQIDATEIREQIVEQAVPVLATHLENYHTFYDRVRAVGDSVIVAEFNLVTADFGRIMRRLNANSDTDFTPYEDSPENKHAIFEESGFHLSPDPKRDSIKEVLRSAYHLQELRPLIDRAEAVYQDMLSLERAQAKQFDRA